MKFSFILIALIYGSLQANAQQKNIFKNNPMEGYKRKQALSQLLRNMNPIINNDKLAPNTARIENNGWVMKTPLTSTYAGNNGKGGDIYKMQPYHMPCLVPDKTFKFNMPVARYEQAGKNIASPFKELEKTEGEK